MEIPEKIKAMPGQLRKSAKLHASQADVMQDFLDSFVKNMKNVVRQKMPLKSTKTLKSNYGNPRKDKSHAWSIKKIS